MKKTLLSLLVLIGLTVTAQNPTPFDYSIKSKFISTATGTPNFAVWDGTNVLKKMTWSDVFSAFASALPPGLPSQTGNSGHVLSTNGTTPYWMEFDLQTAASFGSTLTDTDVYFRNTAEPNFKVDLSSYGVDVYNSSTGYHSKIESDSIYTPKISLYDQTNAAYGNMLLSDSTVSFRDYLGQQLSYFDCGRGWGYANTCGDGYGIYFSTPTFTANRFVTWPNKSGTVQFADDVSAAIASGTSGFVPYTGATTDLNLNNHNFFAGTGGFYGNRASVGSVDILSSTAGVSRLDLFGPTYSFNAVLQVSESGSFSYGDVGNVRNGTVFRVNDALTNKYVSVNAVDGLKVSSQAYTGIVPNIYAITKTSNLTADRIYEEPNGSGIRPLTVTGIAASSDGNIPLVATDLGALKRDGSNANSDLNIGNFKMITGSGFQTDWDNGSMSLGTDYGVPELRKLYFQTKGIPEGDFDGAEVTVSVNPEEGIILSSYNTIAPTGASLSINPSGPINFTGSSDYIVNVGGNVSFINNQFQIDGDEFELKGVSNYNTNGLFNVSSGDKSVKVGDFGGDLHGTSLVIDDGAEVINFTISNLNNFTVNGNPIVFQGVDNPTTIVLTSSDLNTAYPTATTGFRVYCTAIITGKMVYEKTPSGWIGTACIIP